MVSLVQIGNRLKVTGVLNTLDDMPPTPKPNTPGLCSRLLESLLWLHKMVASHGALDSSSSSFK